MMKFLLNSTEAELLLHFETNPSLGPLADFLGRDPTVISRQLKRISEQGDFLIKSHGRWKLTEAGRKYNQATRDYLLMQNKITTEMLHLRIGSTREFCSRILSPNLDDLKEILEVNSVSLIAHENSTESSLLAGKIDISFDCGKPYSPEIVYRQILAEPISPVISKKLKNEYRNITDFKSLEEYPHILCERLAPDRVSKKPFLTKVISAYTNDIATARSLCLTSQGWALLPIYSIKEEIRLKKLEVINNISFSLEKFGVWYLRSRKSLLPIFKNSVDWLIQNNINLGK